MTSKQKKMDFHKMSNLSILFWTSCQNWERLNFWRDNPKSNAIAEAMSLLSMDDEDDTYGFGSFSDLFDGDSRTASSISSAHAGLASASTPSTAPARAAGATKQLDVRAMNRLWVSERALADFEQQLKHQTLPHGDAKEYQHVAAKFDGVTIEGGLGSAFYVQAFGDSEARKSGLLWIQARQSDSNMQEKRKKELQDITSQRYDGLVSSCMGLCANVCLTVVSVHCVLVFISSSGGLDAGAGDLNKDSAKSSSAVFIRSTEITEATPTRIQNTVRGIAFKLQSGNQFEIAFMPGVSRHPSHALTERVLS